ncbi:MAG: hypothetical protein ACOZNI_20345 [Myxococcota bacterium]
MIGILACAEPPAPAAVDPLVDLDAPRLARRMSLDLRGVLPSAEELDAVEADPGALAGLRDAWLDDPRLGDRVVALLHERWRTRVDRFDIPYYDYGFSLEEEPAYVRSVGEEPLRLVARVVTEDRSWSEVVTADWTVADETLAGIWPLAYPEGATGWQEARYTDGRPAAGVLATNGLWWRYTTNTSNMNRARAAAISDLLLCEDILARPVSFSAAELGDPATAVRTEPACLACHAGVDPLAASLFGFWWQTMYSVVEQTTYHPEREGLAEQELGVSPAYFGTPIEGLSELGWAVASDPRLYSCAVETFAAGLWRREVALDDAARLEALRIVFLDEGARVRPLLAAITDDATYRAGGVRDGAPDDVVARERTRRMLAPEQLASAVEDLTGFRWASQRWDQMTSDRYGYRVLAGGVDGATVYTPQTVPGLTWEVVTRRLAEGAAAHAVEAGAWPTDPDVAVAARDLHWRLYAERADEAWLGEVEGLWLAVEAEAGEDAAWAAVLAASLRDPRFLFE